MKAEVDKARHLPLYVKYFLWSQFALASSRWILPHRVPRLLPFLTFQITVVDLNWHFYHYSFLPVSLSLVVESSVSRQPALTPHLTHATWPLPAFVACTLSHHADFACWLYSNCPPCMTTSRLRLVLPVLSPLTKVARCQQHSMRSTSVSKRTAWVLAATQGLRGSLSDSGAPPRGATILLPWVPIASHLTSPSVYMSLPSATVIRFPEESSTRWSVNEWQLRDGNLRSSLVQMNPSSVDLLWNTVRVLGQESTLGLPSEFLSPCQTGDGEGNGTPLQYSCLENPMDGEAWWAAVHGVAKSRARLSDFTFTFHFHASEKEMATHSSILAYPRDRGS